MKQIISIVLALLFTLTLAACGESQDNNPTVDTQALTEEIFTCTSMPANMEWSVLVDLANTVSEYSQSSHLAFLIRSFETGVKANATTSTCSLPLSNLEDAQITCSNLAQWMSWVSACYERTYGSPIFWRISNSSDNRALQVTMTHLDESLLFEVPEQGYSGILESASPVSGTTIEESGLILTKNFPHFLVLKNDSATSHLVLCDLTIQIDDSTWCNILPIYTDSSRSRYISSEHFILPVFSTELLNCSPAEKDFLELWLNTDILSD